MERKSGQVIRKIRAGERGKSELEEMESGLFTCIDQEAGGFLLCVIYQLLSATVHQPDPVTEY